MNPTKSKRKKTEENEMPAIPKSESKSPARAVSPQIRLDESNAKLSYANFFNVSSTREETALMFGMIQVSSNPSQEIVIQVSDRVVITPHAAKRLHTMLGGVIAQYESRFGPLGDEAQPR